MTQAQCSAMGGRITTYTNTAGRGQDVGECLVPPRVAASSNAPPGQQSAPASAQVTLALPQQGDAGPAPQAAPRVAALPADQRRSSSGASGPRPQVSTEPPPGLAQDYCSDPSNYAGDPDCYKYYPAPAPSGFGTAGPNDQICVGGGPFGSSGPNDCKPHWQGDTATCEQANFVERSSAAWGLVCAQQWQGTNDPSDCAMASMDDRQTAKWQAACDKRFYNSPVDPKDLNERAHRACPLGAGMALRQQAGCMAQFKLADLLAKDPAVQEMCSDFEPGARQTECVDEVYLYGRDAGLRLRQSSQLQRRVIRVAPAPPRPLPAWIRYLRDMPDPEKQVDGCALGYGLKQDIKQGGGYTCQPLVGVTLGGPGIVPAAPADDAAARAEAEERIDRTAQLAAAIAADRAGQKLSDADRKACLGEALASARATVKGGAPKLSTMCRQLAMAAVGELANYQRNAPIIAPDPDNATLLAALSGTRTSTGGTLGGNLGPPLPGMTNLGPSDEERRQMDCVARGGTREDCMKAPTTAAPQTAQAPPAVADCSLAAEHWKAAATMNMIEAYQDHLDRFPNCAFATLAKLRIKALHDAGIGVR